MLKRIARLVRGFFALFIKALEERNPDALFEDVRNQIYNTKRDAEQKIIDIRTNAELLKIEIQNTAKFLESVKSKMDVAQKNGDKTLLVELLMQEETYQDLLNKQNEMYDSALRDVTDIKESYKIFESEMNAKLNEIRSLKSQYKMAEIRESINSVNAQYRTRYGSMSNLGDSIERVREVVNKRIARANAVESLNDNTDKKLRSYEAQADYDRFMQKAENMMASR